MFHSKTHSSLRFLLFIFILIFSASSCAPAAMSPEKSAADYENSPTSRDFTQPAVSEEGAPVSGKTNQAQIERLVIKNGSLSIVVIDPPKSMDIISRMAEEMGGFVVTANIYKQELDGGLKVPRGTITIRVPAEQMNEAVARIRAESDQDPISENISSQDVTSEYVDLQSRLKNLEAAESELAEIMKSANKTEDVMTVYNQLVQIREQIEVIKGQIQYYEQSAALSSITVELIADEAIQPLKIGGWQPEGVAKRAVQALINTLKFLAEAIIWIIIYIVPVFLVIYLLFILPFSFIWLAWKRRRKQKKTSKISPPPTETT